MELPIFEKLSQLVNEKAISLHVPGHKNGTIGRIKNLDFKMDMTEITGLDDLHHPEDIILQSMQHCRKHPDYNAYFLINGTTSGILSVIQSFSKRNGDYLISRNVHKSVFHGLDIVQQPADILAMTKSRDSDQYLGPDVHNMKFNHQKLAIVTYPNYYGECFDINEFVDRAHSEAIPVLVDEAHGAHFNLDHFPKSALESGADYVVQSYHKTLPALTMGSILFIHKNAPLKDEIVRYLGYFQTSSPSYLVMASLELAHQFYVDYDSSIFLEKRKQLIDTLNKTGLTTVCVSDPLKLLIQYPGYSGFEIQTWFEKLGIYVELADDKQVLLVLPLWHEDDTYPFEALLNKITYLNLPVRSTHKPMSSIQLPVDEGKYFPSENGEVTCMHIDHAEHSILAAHIIPYPPGIPVYLKGERITRNMIKLMREYLQKGDKVEGIKNEKILVKDE